MKIKIIGLNDRKTLLAVKTLIKSFHIENVLVDEDEDALLIVSYDHLEGKVSSEVKYGEWLFTNTQIILKGDLTVTMKYTILGAVYMALCHISNKILKWGLLSGIRPTKLVHKMMDEGLDQLAILDKLTQFYFLSQEKAKEILDIVNYQIKHIDFKQLEQELSVYINIPFCLSRCTYCSFTSYLSENSAITPNQYVDILIDEIQLLSTYIDSHKIKLSTIYIGGGTPTALPLEALHRLLSAIKMLTKNQVIREYTLESGRPDSLDEEKLQLIRQSDVTRISINPQTFNADTLKRVNRNHTTNEVVEITKLAKDLGLNNINMDLIVGLPKETPSDVIHSINETIALGPESITIHSLSLKRGSRLKEEMHFSHVHDFNQCFKDIQTKLEDNGYQPYYLYRQKEIVGGLENIGYCKTNYISLYNVLMIEEKQNIIGLGCGSSSKFLDYDLIINPRDLLSYSDTYRSYMDKKINKLNELI